MDKFKAFVKQNKTPIIIMGVVIVVLIAGGLLASYISKGAAQRAKDKETKITEEMVHEIEGDNVEAEGEAVDPCNVVPLTEDGPIFPNLDLAVVPTEAPIPEYISLGTEHSIVKKIQERMMDLGFMDMDEPTDYYGEATEAAIKIFQRQNEISQDGIVGPETLEMIFADDAKHYAAKEGDSGHDIISIQERLYQLGYLASSDLVTGTFGEKTKEGVIKLQEVNNITVDGMVGRETYNLIYSDEVRANFLTFGEESDVVLKAQQRLFNLGYMTSTPDGTYGADTESAIKTFQRKNALVVDGYLGPETREILMSRDALPNHLGLGDQNEQVIKVQGYLVKLGYLSSGKQTGYFGEVTQMAVKNFQKQNGLSQDGMVGTKTVEKLTSDKAKKAAPGMLDGANFTKKTSGTSTGASAGSTSTTQGGSAAATGGSGTDAGSTTQTTGGANTPNTDANGVSGSVANLLAVARSKVGCPYVWGSKGPNSFDCSGFVYYVLKECGVGQSYITSAGWRNVGRYTQITNYSDLRAGDVIVVRGHVGFVSTGGMIIDASSSNGRVIERSLGSWWANHFITGWRIF